MNTLGVELGTRSYPIHVGAGLLERGDLCARHLEDRSAVVVTNSTVAPLYLDRVRGGLLGMPDAPAVVLPDGEHYKTLSTFERLIDRLLGLGCGRDCLVVALGGGVIGDIAGFAAACYQRGVDFLQVPTTLLAQVDSAVGGKTGVNHPRGKNMIGAFHQPRCVVADVDTLGTLPGRELRAGLAEVIKYGLISEPRFFAWLENELERLVELDPEALAEAVYRSCECKAAVVSADEREAGARALLNLGHTFGHAIEAGLGYGEWLHGEAVAAGMCMAADLSRRLGLLEGGEVDRVVGLVARAGLPTTAPASLAVERMLELMAHDKKARGGRVRLVVLDAVGSARVIDEYDDGALRATLREARGAQ